MSSNRIDPSAAMIDGFGRSISYVRMSITDRCNLRCRYCMSEKMSFVPRGELLSIEEIVKLADIFINRGVKRIRLTGGEPLVRTGVEDLCRELGRRLGNGLEELTLTTNGTRLSLLAPALQTSGIRRVNISLDTLLSDRFRRIARHGDLSQVLEGIEAAAAAGLKVKINMVALKGLNDDEFVPMLRWCGERGYDLTLIETMPLGEIDEDRSLSFLPLTSVFSALSEIFTLRHLVERTGGPARYFEVGELGIRLGLITPLTNNFCDGCNRIRVTATGTAFGCLGHLQRVELREPLRSGRLRSVSDELDRLLAGKPRRHDFHIERQVPAVPRHMSVTGG